MATLPQDMIAHACHRSAIGSRCPACRAQVPTVPPPAMLKAFFDMTATPEWAAQPAAVKMQVLQSLFLKDPEPPAPPPQRPPEPTAAERLVDEALTATHDRFWGRWTPLSLVLFLVGIATLTDTRFPAAWEGFWILTLGLYLRRVRALRRSFPADPAPVAPTTYRR